MFEVLPESRRVPASRTTGRGAGALSLAAHALVTAWAATVWTLGPDDAASGDSDERASGYSIVRYASVATVAAARTAAVARAGVARRMPRLRPAPDAGYAAASPLDVDVAAITVAIEDEIGRRGDASSELVRGRARVEDFRQPAGGGGLADAIARSVNGGRRGDPFFPTADFPAIPLADNPTPDYPAALLAAGVEGQVRVRFVIDTTGALDPRTVRVVASTNEQFTRAVRAVLPRLRYLPAESGGTKVAALSEQSFAFVVVLR